MSASFLFDAFKLVFFVIILAFLASFAKLAIIAVVAGFAVFKKIFSRDKSA
jgi:uncharacterized membrane-anchored protein